MTDKPKMRYRASSELNKKGEEIPFGEPLTLPSGLQKPPTIQEQVSRLFHSERMKQASINSGVDTPEEADDFFIEDDMFPPDYENEEFEEDFELPLEEAIRHEKNIAESSKNSNLEKKGETKEASGTPKSKKGAKTNAPEPDPNLVEE